MQQNRSRTAPIVPMFLPRVAERTDQTRLQRWHTFDIKVSLPKDNNSERQSGSSHLTV